MQQETFEKDIAYIRYSKHNEVLDLGQNLNLFLDSEEFLQANGRISEISLSEYWLVILKRIYFIFWSIYSSVLTYEYIFRLLLYREYDH